MTKLDMSFKSSVAVEVNSSWNGAPTVINTNQGLSVQQTPNGTTIFAATNQSTQNNAGSVAMTSGGGAPQFIDVPFGANAPTVLMQNWNANNLNVTNVSANNTTPILCQLIGPGIPGVVPLNLPVGTGIQLASGQVAQGTAQPQWMQLVIQSTAATLGVLGVIGGPVTNGNNGYIFAINYSSNVPPAGYTQVTTANTLTYQFNWGASTIFIGNLSPSTAQTLSITLRAL